MFLDIEGDTWQRQCNRLEQGRRNRNVKLQCFPYTRCTLSFAFVFTYLLVLLRHYHIIHWFEDYQGLFVIQCSNFWRSIVQCWGSPRRCKTCHQVKPQCLTFGRLIQRVFLVFFALVVLLLHFCKLKNLTLNEKSVLKMYNSVNRVW